jgi:hypothetical protein
MNSAHHQKGQPVKKEIVISNATKDRVDACKTYIESILLLWFPGKYAKQIKEE